MGEPKHTPGPWRLEQNGPAYNLCSPDRARHFAILVGMIRNQDSEHKANAERIVACVNACEGINPDAVPDLLAVLEPLIAYIDNEGPPAKEWKAIADLCEQGHAVIAKVKEGPCPSP